MSTTKELIEALGTIEYWGEPSIDDFETVELQRAQFDRVVKMLSKAIEQRDDSYRAWGRLYSRDLSPSAVERANQELLKIAKGES